MQKFKVILASSANNVIGKGNLLPWKIKEDMEYFKKLTTFSPDDRKNVVIMGRKTWEAQQPYFDKESLSKNKLPNRIPIVISSTLKQPHDGSYYVVCSFDEAIMVAYNLEKYDIWVIGGKSVYIAAFNHFMCGTIYHTKILQEYMGDVTLELPPHKLLYLNKKENLEFRQIELNGETDYLRILSKILYQGKLRMTRNAKTYSIFDNSITFDMKDGFPLLTTKRMFWKGIVEELLFFIRGDTDSKHLEEKGVKIWQGNTTQEFIDNMNLPYKEGDMGPMYGFMWRHFGAEYSGCDTDYTNKGFDQLAKIVEEIKTNPHSRRILMSDFDPSRAHLGVLYPCHSLVLQFYVRDGKFLDVKMYQRSVDSFLGEPFNIASTSLLLHIISKLTDKKPGKVTLTLGDCHIYSSHIEQVKKQLKRLPYSFPKITLPDFKTIEEVENSSLEDYLIEDYQHHKGIKASMVA